MPLPVSPVRQCPECDAPLEAGDRSCWLCGRIAVSANAAKTIAKPVEASKIASQRNSPGRPQYWIASLLAGTTVVAVGLGAFWEAPGLTIALMILLAFSAVPLAIRRYLVRNHFTPAKPPNHDLEPRLGYWSTFVLIAVPVMAGLLTCAVVLCTAFLVACSNFWRRDRYTELVACILEFGSPVVGLIVAWFVHWMAWRKVHPA